ncbi:hypothetical protein DXA24_11780 [Bacteroides sp. CF01-10NS]|nr:hypothetical protein DXA24_11780 [Bacteroides sp. CF01-10NS]
MFGSTTFIFQSVEEGMGICQRIVYISYPDSWENKPLPSRIVRGNREAASQKIDYLLFKIILVRRKIMTRFIG